MTPARISVDVQHLDARARAPMSYWLFAICGTWLIGLGVYFIWLRAPLLPEDARFMGGSAQLLQSIPKLSEWLDKVFVVLGGFMIATGTLTVAVARNRQHQQPMNVAALCVAGIAGVALMSAVNFALDSDFKWLLIVPACVWFSATLARAVGK